MFSRIGIVGLGLMGGSLGLAIRRQWPGSLVIGVDRKDVIERATITHVIDVGAEDLGMISDAELIVLAAPVAENERILADVAALVSGDAILTDLGSTKRGIVEAGRNLHGRATFIGGHPMAGASVAGLEHARPDLYADRPWILCPSRPSAALPKLKEFVAALGARCVEMSAEEHDRLLACLSHLPQLTASALMHVVGEAAGREGLAIAGRGLQDSTRLASSPPDLWRDVCVSNADNIGPALDTLIEVLKKLRGDLERGDVLETIFKSAQEWKAQLEGR